MSEENEQINSESESETKNEDDIENETKQVIDELVSIKPARQIFSRKLSPLVRNAIKAQLESKKNGDTNFQPPIQEQKPVDQQSKKIDSRKIMIHQKTANNSGFSCEGCYYCNWTGQAESVEMCKINYYELQ